MYLGQVPVGALEAREGGVAEGDDAALLGLGGEVHLLELPGGLVAPLLAEAKHHHLTQHHTQNRTEQQRQNVAYLLKQDTTT